MQNASQEVIAEPSNWSEIETAVRERGELDGLVPYFTSEHSQDRLRARGSLASGWSEVAARRRFPEWSGRGAPGPALWEPNRLERYIDEHIVRPGRTLFRKNGLRLTQYVDDLDGEVVPDSQELIDEIAKEVGLAGKTVSNALRGRRRSLDEHRKREKERKAQPVDLRTPEGREVFRLRGVWRRPLHKVYENLGWKYQLVAVLKDMRTLQREWSDRIADGKPVSSEQFVREFVNFRAQFWKTTGFSVGLRGNLEQIGEIIAALDDARPALERRVRNLIVQSEGRVIQAAPDFMQLLLDESADLSADTGRLLSEFCSRCRLGRYSSVATA